MLKIDDYADDVLLPQPEDREWLLGKLTDLIDMGGYEPFVVAPLIESNETFFPDPWKGGEASMARLARRLLHYAGIDDLDVRARIFEEEDAITDSRGPTGNDFGIWFDGVKDGVCKFGAFRPMMGGPLEVVAGMARAVAAAWRWQRGLVTMNKEETEPLLDLTTVYLGFGLLTTDAALRHETDMSGGARRAKRSQRKLGALSARAMAFGLAAQAVARGLDRGGRKQVARQLQSNQAGMFRNAVGFLSDLEPDVRTWLHIPAPSEWPEPPDLEELTAPADDEHVEEEAPPEVPDVKPVEGSNEGKPVFAVQRTMAMRIGKYLGLPAGVLGLVAVRLAPPDSGLSMQHIIPIVAGLFVTGVLIGSLFTERTCSEPRCLAKLPPDAKTCPRCGGTVMGTIAHARERLAAEDALAKESDSEGA